MRTKTRQLILNIATGVAIAATAAVVFTPAAVLAAPATATTNVNVRATPGGAIVDNLRAGQRVDVGECRGSWCFVTKPGVDGWVSANYLSRGGGGGGLVGPANPGISIEVGPGGISIGTPRPQRPTRPVRPPVFEEDVAEVCFYERTNFRGNSFCVEEGDSLPRLGQWRDRISSFTNDEGLRVRVCLDQGFSSCRTYTSSARSLGDFNQSVASIRVD